jgi:hypothetical protein
MSEELEVELAKLYQQGVRDGVEMAVRTLRKALDEILGDLEENPPTPPAGVLRAVE